MNKLSEEIILVSFIDELEKQAGFETLVKVLKNADLIAGTKGIREGLKVLEKHKGALSAVSKGALKNTVKVETYGKEVGGAEKFVLRQLGDTAEALGRVSKGVGKHQSVLKNVSTVGQNFGKLLRDQVRGARYKVIPKETAAFPILDKGKTIQGKGLFKNLKSLDRPIQGKTSSGDYIVKKRKAVVPLAMALTPVGFGAGTFLLGSGKKKETLGSRTSAGLKETAMWSLVPPVAQANLISDMLK